MHPGALRALEFDRIVEAVSRFAQTPPGAAPPLEPAQLVALAVFLASVDGTCVAVRRARSTCPILRAIADTSASFDPEIADIRRKIDPGGEVVDEASPALRAVRDRLRKQRARLRGTLESYLRGKGTAKKLQQQMV